MVNHKNDVKRLFHIEQIGIHEREIRKQLREFVVPNGIEPVEEPVAIILFTNRSGSSMIAEYLRATGKFRGLGEPLNNDWVSPIIQKEDIQTFGDYIRYTYEKSASSDSFFGLKAGVQQAMMLMRSGIIPRYFSNVRWVLVQRNDLISQVISFDIASQTKRWESFSAGNDEEPKYDFQRIRKKLGAVSLQQSAIKKFCAIYEIEPYVVDYDKYCDDPVEGTRNLASYLGKDRVQVDSSRLKRRKQSDDRNTEFRRRFIADYRASILSRD